MKKVFLQKISLLISDIISLAFTYWLSIIIANILEPSRLHCLGTRHLVLLKVLNALCVISLLWMAELYSKRRPVWEELRIIYRQILIILFIDLVAITLSGSEQVTYLFFFMYWALLFVTLPTFRVITISLLNCLGLWQRVVYIVGSGNTALSAYHLLVGRLLLGYQIKAFVTLDEAKSNIYSKIQVNQGLALPIIKFNELLKQNKSAEIIVALESVALVSNISKIFSLQRKFLFVSLVPELEELPLYGIEVNHFFASEQLLLRLENNLNRYLNRAIKFIFDYVVILLSLPLLLPLMLIISIIIFMEDRHNPFFLQKRIGYRGKVFYCIKFRTMCKNAELMLEAWQTGNKDIFEEYVKSNYKLKRDPRVTRVGRILRKASLDELAQVINVLLGQMSLVGPRPLLKQELEAYGEEGLFYYTMVKPGITGVWQVSGRSSTSFADRCRLDTWYIKNWSLWYDVVVLLKTIIVVVNRNGAY